MRGRGVHETMRVTWLSTLPDCTGISQPCANNSSLALQALCCTQSFDVDYYLIHRTRKRASADMRAILPLFTHYLQKFCPRVHDEFDWV
jgi:hypothetical protein